MNLNTEEQFLERLYGQIGERLAVVRRCVVCGLYEKGAPEANYWCDFGAHWVCAEHIHSTCEDSALCVECEKTLPKGPKNEQ